MKPTPPKSATVAACSRTSVQSSGSSETYERILGCAHQVLIKHGYAGFTTRRVATAASISLGNLTYHFPSKRDLLQAVVAYLVAKYSNQFDAIISDPDIPKGQELKSLLRWLLTDAVDDENVRISRVLWAISLHDDVIRNAMDDLYDDLMSKVVQLLKRSHPNANIQSIREIVQLLGLLTEGSIVLYGTRRDRVVPVERIIELSTALLGSISPELQISTDDKFRQKRPAKGASARRS